MTLNIVSLLMFAVDVTPAVPPSLDDIITVWVARGSMILALLVGALSLYYHFWVVRLQAQEDG